MAENVAITPGTGDVVAADDIGGAKFQRVKLIHGADGTNDGDVSTANGLPVQGTVTANLSATDNAVLDDIASDTEAIKTSLETAGGQLVNLGANNDVTVTGSVTVDLGVNNDVTLATLPDTAAGDLAAIESNTDGIETTLSTIDGKITACNTGAIAGTVTANLSATDNAVLDDIASDTEAIKTSLAGTLTVTGGGGGTEYTEGATDATITGAVAMMEVAGDAVQPIQGTVAGGLLVNLGSNNDVTVTGTVDLGATDNAVLDNIDADLTTVIGHVDGIEAAVDGIEGLLTTIDGDTGNIATDTSTIAGDTTSIDGKIPALGQALAAASVPVVLTAAQITTLTPPAAIAGFATESGGNLDTIAGDTTSIDGKITACNTGAVVLAAGVAEIGNVKNSGNFAVQADTELTTDDLDTGAGTDTRAVVGLVGSKSGGGELIPGSATDGLLVNLGANNDISGTVTANLSATDNAVLDAIESDTTTIAGAVSGTEMQVDVITMPTTTVQATNLDIRDLTATDVITANLSAVDNAVLDDIAANQTDASQKTQIVDGSGNVIGATSNALDVNIKSGGAGDGAILDGASSAIKATVLDYTNSNPLAVRLTDTGGDYVAAGAGTQYTEDAAAAANPIGSVVMLIREDGLGGSLTTTDGDNVAQRGNNKGEAYVKDTDAGTILGTIDTAIDAINAKLVSGTDIGDVTINNSTGAAAVNIQDGGNTITVDGTVAVTNADITSCKTALELLDNSVDGNYLNVNANIAGTDLVGGAGAVAAGVQRVTLASDDPAVVSLGNLDNSVDGNYLNVNMNIAGADVSATVPMPVRPNEFELASVTTHTKKYYTNAGAVTDGIVWSPAAGKRWYITDICINVSAAATVTLEDDLAGGDSAVWKAELAANSGWSHSFTTPLYSGEDAADLIITTSAGNVYCTVVGYEI